jgi:hypothetical protein
MSKTNANDTEESKMHRSGLSLIFGVGGTTVFDREDRDAGLRELVENEIEVAAKPGAFAYDELGQVADCLRGSAHELRALADMLDKAADEQSRSV